MLVLTRKKDQQIVIDDVIRVTVIAIEGNRVRLGFEAPLDVKIDREEVHRRSTEAVSEGTAIGSTFDCADSGRGVVLQL
jgi:carbon storage regulator